MYIDSGLHMTDLPAGQKKKKKRLLKKKIYEKDHNKVTAKYHWNFFQCLNLLPEMSFRNYSTSKDTHSAGL